MTMITSSSKQDYTDKPFEHAGLRALPAIEGGYTVHCLTCGERDGYARRIGRLMPGVSSPRWVWPCWYPRQHEPVELQERSYLIAPVEAITLALEDLARVHAIEGCKS